MVNGRLRRTVGGRGFLLMPAAALAVHQIRFKLAYGSQSGEALAAQGHSYLNSLAPWLVLLLAVGLGAFVVRVARAAAGRRTDHPRRSFLALWALASAGLVAIYATQELLEGLFAVGHPGGAAGVFGHGGWWALVLAAVAGAGVAAVLQVACTIVGAAERFASRRGFHGLPPLVPRPEAVSLAPRAALAGAAAGRAPPAA
jgi:hypothetical protein